MIVDFGCDDLKAFQEEQNHLPNQELIDEFNLFYVEHKNYALKTVEEVLTPEVTETYVDSGNYLQINGLGVIDENVLAYHRNEDRYQFVSTIELTVGGEFDMVRYVDGQIVHEEVESKEIVYLVIIISHCFSIRYISRIEEQWWISRGKTKTKRRTQCSW